MAAAAAESSHCQKAEPDSDLLKRKSLTAELFRSSKRKIGNRDSKMMMLLVRAGTGDRRCKIAIAGNW